MDNTWLLHHKHIQNGDSVDCIWSCSLEGNFSFLCYGYKTLLQFFTWVSTTISAEGCQ